MRLERFCVNNSNFNNRNPYTFSNMFSDKTARNPNFVPSARFRAICLGKILLTETAAPAHCENPADEETNSDDHKFW